MAAVNLQDVYTPVLKTIRQPRGRPQMKKPYLEQRPKKIQKKQSTSFEKKKRSLSVVAEDDEVNEEVENAANEGEKAAMNIENAAMDVANAAMDVESAANEVENAANKLDSFAALSKLLKLSECPPVSGPTYPVTLSLLAGSDFESKENIAVHLGSAIAKLGLKLVLIDLDSENVIAKYFYQRHLDEENKSTIENLREVVQTIFPTEHDTKTAVDELHRNCAQTSVMDFVPQLEDSLGCGLDTFFEQFSSNNLQNANNVVKHMFPDNSPEDHAQTNAYFVDGDKNLAVINAGTSFKKVGTELSSAATAAAALSGSSTTSSCPAYAALRFLVSQLHKHHQFTIVLFFATYRSSYLVPLLSSDYWLTSTTLSMRAITDHYTLINSFCGNEGAIDVYNRLRARELCASELSPDLQLPSRAPRLLPTLVVQYEVEKQTLEKYDSLLKLQVPDSNRLLTLEEMLRVFALKVSLESTFSSNTSMPSNKFPELILCGNRVCITLIPHMHRLMRSCEDMGCPLFDVKKDKVKAYYQQPNNETKEHKMELNTLWRSFQVLVVFAQYRFVAFATWLLHSIGMEPTKQFVSDFVSSVHTHKAAPHRLTFLSDIKCNYTITGRGKIGDGAPGDTCVPMESTKTTAAQRSSASMERADVHSSEGSSSCDDGAYNETFSYKSNSHEHEKGPCDDAPPGQENDHRKDATSLEKDKASLESQLAQLDEIISVLEQMTRETVGKGTVEHEVFVNELKNQKLMRDAVIEKMKN